VEFLGFTAPLPHSVRPSGPIKYFNGGTGVDWISRIPQFFCSYTNLSVFVHEAARIRKEKNLVVGKSALHKLLLGNVSDFRHESFCYSDDLHPKDMEHISRSRSRGLLIVRDIREMSNSYLSQFRDVPALTVLFPLIYHSTKVRCEDYADICIPDNYLLKTIPRESTGICSNSDWWTNIEKPKILVFPGKLYERKGQLAFLQYVGEASLRGYTLKFYGKVLDGSYRDLVREKCTEQGLTCEFYGVVSHEELMKAYLNSSGIISFGVSEIDPNPRVVVESLSCNKPVLLGPETVTASKVVENFPLIGRKVSDVNETRETFQLWIQQEYGNAPRNFYDVYASEGTVYSNFVRVIHDRIFRTNWTRQYAMQ